MRVEIPWHQSDDNLKLDVSQLVPMGSMRAEDLLFRDLPDHARVACSPVLPLETVAGWPAKIYRAGIYENDRLAEVRMVVHYEVVVYSAFVLVRARDVAQLEADSADVVERLANVRVELASDEPAAVLELWTV